MTADPKRAYRYLSRERRVREDRRFLTGAGRFVADVTLPGMKHVALVQSPHACAEIRAIDVSRALALPGVLDVISGEELAAVTAPLPTGLDIPAVRRYPLAVGRARYSGEWVAAVVADSRAVAEDAAALVEVAWEPREFVLDAERALRPDSPPVHPAHGSNVLLQRRFRWGDLDRDFARSDHRLSYRVHWARSSTVPIETFGVVARWDPWDQVLDVWASIQMPKYDENIARTLRLPGNAVRVHYDVDVGGSYGVKRGIKHTVLAGYLARKLGCPVRLVEDRLENMSGGDAHGPDRVFDVEMAFDRDGTINAMKLRALDDVGAYSGRAPLQLGKPVGAIVGPYRIASVQYEAVAVTTNKTVQEAVRGFGQAPTNYAIESGVDRVARFLGLDRHRIRAHNFIRRDQFPYRIPSGTEYDSGDYHAVQAKTLELAGWPELVSRRDALRARGELAGLGIAGCLEPSGGNAAFEPLLNPRNDTTTWMDSGRVKVDALGDVTVVISTTSAGQGHETLASAVAGEVLERDPDSIRVVRANSLSASPSNSPVASRMAIMLGGAVARAARGVRDKLLAIAAHELAAAPQELVYAEGAVSVAGDPARRLEWSELARIAHRNVHRLPPGMAPGLEHSSILQVPRGGALPGPDGSVQMYPCYSFEYHVALVRIDAETGTPSIVRYYVGHDCGTVITPAIVRGMTLGGIAHGIGAALYEKFRYDGAGQLVSQTLMDYPMPSAREIPRVELTEHHTPSPYTAFGQKGAGEGGYMGAPAAVASAVNDALAPLGVSLDFLPMTPCAIEALVSATRNA